MAAVLETLQLIIPGRDGRCDDMLVKATAGVVFSEGSVEKYRIDRGVTQTSYCYCPHL